MIVIISILIGVLAIAVLLTLVSENFADGVSRVVEAAFDAVEYRLALADERGARQGREAAAGGGAYERAARAVGV